MKKTVKDVNWAGKTAVMRCDFNVPQDKETGAIKDDTRIVAALPTIKYLLENGAKVVLMSHLGRPKGEANPTYTLAPVAKRLGEYLNQEVKFVASDVVVDDNVKAAAKALNAGEAMLIENVRYRAEEEKNDPDFSKALSELGDIFVQDAFGTAHRAHASTTGIADYLPAVSGFLIEKELKFLGEAVENPQRPFAAIMGGAKVKDKIPVITNLLDKVDILVIGGGMLFTFLKAHGGEIGNSIVELDKLDVARGVEELAKKNGVELVLGCDSVCCTDYDFATASVKPGAKVEVFNSNEIPAEFEGLDAGPKSREKFAEAIKGAKTILWNGPAGCFECEDFTPGSRAVGEAVAAATAEGAFSLIGGGDSVACVNKFGLADKVSYISTGGGALLEAIEGKVLPGVAAIQG